MIPTTLLLCTCVVAFEVLFEIHSVSCGNTNGGQSQAAMPLVTVYKVSQLGPMWIPPYDRCTFIFRFNSFAFSNFVIFSGHTSSSPSVLLGTPQSKIMYSLSFEQNLAIVFNILRALAELRLLVKASAIVEVLLESNIYKLFRKQIVCGGWWEKCPFSSYF